MLVDFSDVDRALGEIVRAARRRLKAAGACLRSAGRDVRSGRAPDDGVCARVARSGRAVIAGSTVAVPAGSDAVLACSGARFGKPHVQALAEIASFAAAAMRLLDLEERDRRATQRLEMLNHLARLQPTMDARAYLERVTDQLRRAFDACWSAVQRCDEEAQELVLLASASDRPVPTAVARLKVGQGLTGKAFKLGEVVNAKEVSRDPFYVAGTPDVRSELCVPVRAGDRAVGMLDLQSRAPAAFDAQDALVVETVARLLAPVLARVV